MELFFSAILILQLLLKCHGHTYLYYHHDEDGKITLSCEHYVQQISNQLDPDWEKTCDTPPIDEEGSGESDPLCSEKCFEKYKDGKHQIKSRSGFYACVRYCSDHSISPFKSHSDVVNAYIVAGKDTQLLHEDGNPSQIVTEGSDIVLSCSFTRDTDGQEPYVLYWVKMISENGRVSCISSFSSDNQSHCLTDSDLHSRMTISSPAPSSGSSQHHSHNISIGQSRPSDSGVYVCVLNLQERAAPPSGQNPQPDRWIIMGNITVDVLHHSNKVGLHVAVAVCVVCTLLTLTLLLVWRKMKSHQARHNQMMQRSNDEGNTDPYCSPNAVDFRQHNPYSVVNIRGQMDSTMSTPVGPSGLSSDVPEPYSVVNFRGQMDSTTSTPVGPNGLSSDVPEPYSVVQRRTKQDNPASTPARPSSETIDPYSIVQLGSQED